MAGRTGRITARRFAALGLAAMAAMAAAGLWRHGVPSWMPPAGAAAVVPVPGFSPGPGPAVRLAVLGTSLSARSPWPEELAAALGACRTGPVAVARVARPGATSPWGADRLAEALGTPGDRPDLLLLEFAINDAAAYGPSLARSQALHRAMLGRAADAGVPVLLLTMNPAWGRERLERPGLPAYLALYPALARTHGTGLVDTVPAWRALAPAERRALVPDGLHPAPDGMRRVLLPALLDALGPALCAGPDR